MRTFSDVLVELQQLHDCKVQELFDDNAALRGELSRREDHAHGVSYALGDVSAATQMTNSRVGVQVEARIPFSDRSVEIANPCASAQALCPPASEGAASQQSCPGRERKSQLLKRLEDKARVAAEAAEAAEAATVLAPKSLKMDWHRFRTISFSNALSTVTSPTRQCLYKWVKWEGFDIALGLVIIANAVTIGIDTSLRLDAQATPLYIDILEYIFLATYTVELGLRFSAMGTTAFRSNWVKFDAFLVCGGLVDLVVKWFNHDKPVYVLDKIILIRILRLARIARVFRLVAQFKTLWVLVQGMLQSLMTLFWTFILVSIMIYTFAIFAVEMIKPDDAAGESYNVAVRENFGSFLDSCLTLCQGLTLDSIGAVYRPIIVEKPFMVFYFVVYIMLVSISLMNLVTAIIVESTLNFQQENKHMIHVFEEAKQKALLVEVHNVFSELDTDGSGVLTLEKLEKATEEAQKHLRSIVRVSDWSAIFSEMGTSNSGTITIDDFCAGILATLEGTPIELINIMQQLEAMRKHNEDMHWMVSVLHRASQYGSHPFAIPSVMDGNQAIPCPTNQHHL